LKVALLPRLYGGTDAAGGVGRRKDDPVSQYLTTDTRLQL
jgi:hypothetical protein